MNKRRWFKIAYWSAAIADFIIAARVLIPGLVGFEEYSYPAGIVGAVCVSWGILLIVADKDPFERRWILKPTILVIFLILLVYAYSTISGEIPLFLGVPSVSLAIAILVINIIAYRSCSKGTVSDDEIEPG